MDSQLGPHLRKLIDGKSSPLGINEIYAHGAVASVSASLTPWLIGVAALAALVAVPMFLQSPPTEPAASPPTTTAETTTTTAAPEVEEKKSDTERTIEVIIAREDDVAVCMAAAGFEYIPNPKYTEPDPDREWTGWGIATPVFYDLEWGLEAARIGGFLLFIDNPDEVAHQLYELSLRMTGQKRPPEDPNEAIRKSLSPEEMTAYNDALLGSSGCIETAYQANPYPAVDPVAADIFERLHKEVDARIAADPRMAQAQVEMAACPSAAGVDLGGSDLRQEFRRRTGMPLSHENVGKADPDIVAELRTEELRQAEAAARCEKPYNDLRTEAELEIEAAVVESIPGAMQALIEQQRGR